MSRARLTMREQVCRRGGSRAATAGRPGTKLKSIGGFDLEAKASIARCLDLDAGRPAVLKEG